jgi:Glycine cleavage system protein P (pyridoxal-binding), N-terminal domain
MSIAESPAVSPAHSASSALAADGAVRDASFATRHIGLSQADEAVMLEAVGATSREALIEQIVPANIFRHEAMRLPLAISETAALAELRSIASRNTLLKSFIGQGYHGTHTPAVIQRNILKNMPAPAR